MPTTNQQFNNTQPFANVAEFRDGIDGISLMPSNSYNSPIGGGVNNVGGAITAAGNNLFNQPSYSNPIGGAVNNVGSTLQSLGMQQPTASSAGFDLGGFAQGLLGAGVDYYAGQQDIDAAAQFGQMSNQAAQQMGQQAVQGTSFKPFSVTTGAGTTQTDAQGGFNLGLSPEQAAMQAQLTQQAGGLFSGVTGDVGQASQDIYNQIRAIQNPEEQRDQLRLNEKLFARGRGGVSSAQYGGQGAEQFGFNQAQQEAMNQAAFQARQMALSEQEQMLGLGQGLLGQAYVPQQQQLDALTAGTNIANIAGTGQRQGAQLQAELGGTGLEALLRSYESGLAGEQTQRNQLVDLLLGSGQGANAVEGLLGGSSLGGSLGAAVGVGDAPNSGLKIWAMMLKAG